MCVAAGYGVMSAPMSSLAPVLWIDGQPFEYVHRVERGTCRDCGSPRAGLDAYQGAAGDATADPAPEAVTFCPDCAQQHATA